MAVKPLLIGLTGGIGSGKTTVANRFAAEFAVPLLDADNISRSLTQDHTGEALPQIQQTFGENIFSAPGVLDRRKLRETIFANPQAKQHLETIIHPLVHERIQAMIRELPLSTPYALLIVPLMFESGLNAYCQRILVVDCEPDIQIQRVMQRDQVSRQQVEAIIAQQMPREVRLRRADDILVNNNTDDAMQDLVKTLHSDYKMLANHSLT